MLMALAEMRAKQAVGRQPERRLWLFDTFEGLPQPGDADYKLATK